MTPHREEEPTTRVLAEALAEAADDLGKASNQFAALAHAGEAPTDDWAIFEEKEAKARAALARITSPEGSSEAEARADAHAEGYADAVRDAKANFEGWARRYGLSREPASPVQSPSPEAARVETDLPERIRDAVHGVGAQQIDPSGVTDWLIELVSDRVTPPQAPEETEARVEKLETALREIRDMRAPKWPRGQERRGSAEALNTMRNVARRALEEDHG